MRMPKVNFLCCDIWQRCKKKYHSTRALLKLTRHTLFYNEFTSLTTVLDTIMEPLFWFVDHFVRYLGPAFVCLVVCLTLSVVVIFYICLLPHQYEESLTWTIIHLLVGHYFLMCITFHYFKAAFTDPGSPPEKIEEVVSICKRCIGPKPPRTHHCSVCKKCILKMDHHCPWLNNCVGQYNQRYFFLFCMYMWVGTVYVSYTAYPMFKQHFYGDEDPGPSGLLYPLYLAKRSFQSATTTTPPPDPRVLKGDLKREHSVKPPRDTSGLTFHNMIIYEFMLCSAVSVALAFLIVWQCRLISWGETSIEWHINKREKERQRKMGKVYRNPYNFGFKVNWWRFLGINEKGMSFWRHVLWPSNHPPDGDGLKWKTVTYSLENKLLLL